MIPPAEGYDRHAHRERLAGGDAARVGECVERDVHIPVLCEMAGAERAHLHAFCGNPAARETIRRELSALRTPEELALDEQTRARYSIEHLFPEMQHLVRHLAEIVERAERHAPVFLRRRRDDGGKLLGQHIAEMAVRQTDHLLGEGGICRPDGVNVHIREHIVVLK